MGWIVCIDVPDIAYRRAGFSIKQMLAADFKIHPGAYDTRNGNNPASPFFHRRARNLYAYCRANGRLLPMSERPEPADVIFFKKPGQKTITHIALVIGPGGKEGCRMVEAAPETVLTREPALAGVEGRGWRPQGIGRLLGQPPGGAP
ncbi:MAG: DUF1287 domain-containing protein [Acidobacteriota bacterium]